MNHIHRYQRVSENKDGIVEVCSEASCHKRLVSKKDGTGRVDNRAWLKEHVADTAQPRGATAKIFAKVYGKPKK